MQILGIVITVVSLAMMFFSPNAIAIIGVPAGIFLSAIGGRMKNNRRIINLVQGVNFVGKDLADIERVIGVHTNVNISSDNKRVYIWENYLELLCNKDNVCVEVLKDLVNN